MALSPTLFVATNNIPGTPHLSQVGGKAAGWGFVCSAASMGIGLAVHTLFLSAFGTVGLVFGLGIYATRFLHRYKNIGMEEVDEMMRDIELLFMRGRITKEQYDAACQKVLKKAGLA